ncbi:trypco2 family protein [Amycolatopsis kentuckyensis]|uniref:trypco2 family protein n=1 Tax=Amycolatopsis kentuckyensis TaxID=218823 RepID=UPI00356970B9
MADEVSLATVLEGLRDELEAAWERGRDRAIKFQASEVTVTLQTVARREADGSGKIRWYVVEAGAGLKSSEERTQSLTLKLTPLIDGKPMQVFGHQTAPGK